MTYKLDSKTVSVALCTHNGAAFIDEQLQTIYFGSVQPTETVVCDDLSVDQTCKIVSVWMSNQPSIRLIQNNPILGVTKNFEKALSLTTGEIIFLCDQDDKWHPDKLSIIVATFERRSDLLLIHSDARLVDASGASINCSLFQALEVSKNEMDQIRSGNAFNALMRHNLVTGATAAFRRSLLTAALPIPAEWVHDEWLAIIASAIGKVDFLNEMLIDYRQHGRNQIGMRKLTLTEKIKKAFTSRPNFHLKQVRRTEVLLERLLSLGPLVPPRRIDMVRVKLLHHKICAQYPTNRLRRIVPILCEILTGRYSQYSTGLRSIIRDLFEPA